MAQHILVVEDDPKYRTLVRRMLEAAGFRVTTAEDFNSAMTVIEGGEPLDLLLTDVNLPLQTPHGLAIGLMTKSKRPGMPIVYMTGAFDPVKFAELTQGSAVVQKPFSASDIVAAINRALQSPASSPG